MIVKESSNCQIIDFGVPYCTNVDSKVTEKIGKYQSVWLGSWKKLWNITIEVIPVVMGDLRTPCRKLKVCLDKI